MSLQNLQSRDKPKTGEMFPWLWFFVRSFKKKFWLFSISRVVREGLFLLTPLLIKFITDYIQSDKFLIDPYFMLWFFGLYILANSIAYFMHKFNFFEAGMRHKLVRSMAVFSLDHMANMSIKWHESVGTGGKMQRVMHGRQSFADLMRLYFNDILTLVGGLIATTIYLILGAPLQYAFILFIYSIIFITLSHFYGKKLLLLHDKSNHLHENVIIKAYDFVSSFITLKALNLFPLVRKKIYKAEEISQNAAYKIDGVVHNKWLSLNFCGLIFFMGSMIYAFFQLVNGIITIGTFIMIMWLFNSVWNYLENIGSIEERYIEGKNGFIRLVNVLKQDIDIVDFKPFKHFPKNWNKIEFKNVTMEYSGKSGIKEINLQIKRGENIAIVGKSGAGKSTFIKLLLKQILPDKGSITVDGIDTKNILKRSLLTNIAVVLQNIELFNVSIKENVLIQAKDTKKLNNYLKMANAYDFVKKLPNKELSVVGEKGLKLSGGERQRIAIARALAKESEIIVFDEATSSLDSESERAIQDAMKDIFKNKTSIVIAHRLSTIKEADRIIVFDKGKIVEDGSFNDLLKQKGIFAKLWKLQKLS